MIDRRKKYRFHSLNLKIVLVTLLALIVGMLSFYATYRISSYLVDTMYMSESSASARKARIYTEFNRYVTANKISGKDTTSIALWSDRQSYVSIFVYTTNDTAVHPNSRIQGESSPVLNVSQYSGQYGKLYPMKFSDGTYQIAIADTSQEHELFINLIISIGIGVILFVAIVLAYTVSMTNRIISLSRQAYYIANGDLDAPLYSGHGDEISVLADHVDNLRNSVVEKMTNEHEAWQANSDLITAISHDIRTPMTSLIGYLDLLNEDGFNDKDKCAVFTTSARNKAMALKNLTDELFRYFLVFGNTDPKLENDYFDGVMLFGQLLSEVQFELADLGFDFQISFPDDECTIYVDPMYLKRVIDNIVSNIKKYADKACPVTSDIRMKDNRLCISITNTVYSVAPSVESNKIGLKTCRRIMELLNGSFTSSLSDNSFTAVISLPYKQ